MVFFSNRFNIIKPKSNFVMTSPSTRFKIIKPKIQLHFSVLEQNAKKKNYKIPAPYIVIEEIAMIASWRQQRGRAAPPRRRAQLIMSNIAINFG